MSNEQIHIFTVGGTIDKIYFDAKSTYEVGPPNIPEILDGLHLNLSCAVESLMRKDSLDMTEADRQTILAAVQGAAGRRVVITHGTDTMVDTARVLSAVPDKTIVLTGSLTPAVFKNSDAMFNIGAALTAVQTMPTGVYIAMNGEIFRHDAVRKDRDANRFVAL
ncbi:MAG: asparaginase domain-containing protein [Pseudohongiellaceae bacterium]